jgi:hypothetical protein
MSDDRCEKTELLVAECAHCRPQPEPEPHDIGPVFDGVYRGECYGCDTHIDPGDKIRAVDGWYVHEGCEPR